MYSLLASHLEFKSSTISNIYKRIQYLTSTFSKNTQVKTNCKVIIQMFWVGKMYIQYHSQGTEVNTSDKA